MFHYTCESSTFTTILINIQRTVTCSAHARSWMHLCTTRNSFVVNVLWKREFNQFYYPLNVSISTLDAHSYTSFGIFYALLSIDFNNAVKPFNWVRNRCQCFRYSQVPCSSWEASSSFSCPCFHLSSLQSSSSVFSHCLGRHTNPS